MKTTYTPSIGALNWSKVIHINSRAVARSRDVVRRIELGDTIGQWPASLRAPGMAYTPIQFTEGVPFFVNLHDGVFYNVDLVRCMLYNKFGDNAIKALVAAPNRYVEEVRNVHLHISSMMNMETKAVVVFIEPT